MKKGYYELSGNLEGAYTFNKSSSERNLHFSRFLKKVTSMDASGVKNFISDFVEDKYSL